jgi:signal transduction histidine kinase
MLTEDLCALAASGQLHSGLREHVEETLPATLDGIQRVNTIVRDLRSFSREDRGTFVDYDLNEQVMAALRIAQPTIRGRVDVVTNLGRVPIAVGQPQRLTQVFVNLVVNAAQAIPGRGTVTITTRCDPYEHTVEIRDDGTGMSPEVLERLFTPFFTTKPVGEGTGLGLAVAHGIVRAHGGRIAATSKPGKGSTFSVHLPRVPPGVPRRSA